MFSWKSFEGADKPTTDGHEGFIIGVALREGDKKVTHSARP